MNKLIEKRRKQYKICGKEIIREENQTHTHTHTHTQMQYRIPRGSVESSFGRLDPLQRQLGLLRCSSWAKLFIELHDKFLFSYYHLIFTDTIKWGSIPAHSDVHYFSPPIFWDRIRFLPYFRFLPCILKSPIHNYKLGGIIISIQFLLKWKRDTANAILIAIIIINDKWQMTNDKWQMTNDKSKNSNFKNQWLNPSYELFELNIRYQGSWARCRIIKKLYEYLALLNMN